MLPIHPEISRREFLVAAALAGAGLALRPTLMPTKVPFVLPLWTMPLPLSSLNIDKATMTLHHDFHHAAYVKNLNEALTSVAGDHQNWDLEQLVKDYDSLPESIRTAVRDNGGGNYNHSLFWKMIGPPKSAQPSPALRRGIDQAFSSFKGFQQAFSEASMARFGSGWVWLVKQRGGKLGLASSANQDNPLTDGLEPLLGIDLWEHAYYLKHQNRRKDYIDTWWNVVQWDYVNDRHAGKVKLSVLDRAGVCFYNRVHR